MAKKGYKFLGHMADVEFISSGRSIDEAFKNAFMALFDTVCYVDKVSKARAKTKLVTISDKAKELDQLLWYALQDAVSIMDSRGLFGYKVSKLKVSKTVHGYKISAVIATKERKNEHTKLDVKGIARYGLKLYKKGNTFNAHVIMDV
jgi:SHS2 domain-containing protein